MPQDDSSWTWTEDRSPEDMSWEERKWAEAKWRYRVKHMTRSQRRERAAQYWKSRNLNWDETWAVSPSPDSRAGQPWLAFLKGSPLLNSGK